MANVDRDNMLNEEQESSQSNSSNGSGAVPQQQSSPSSGGGFQLKSSILRQPATFGSGAGAGGGLQIGLFGTCSTAGSSAPIGSFNLKPSVLKPSHFGSFGGDKNSQNDSKNNGTGFVTNPFLKTQKSEEDSMEQKSNENSDKDDSSDPLTKLTRATLPKSNLFTNVKSISENTGFVFGQNVHERVTGENVQMDGPTVPTAGLSFSSALSNHSNDSSSSNPATAGGKPLLSNTAASSSSRQEGNDESLEEAARRYEESRGALKRKFDEVETITGEEDERNVVEVNCKLFAFAKGNWEERGHGMLRLNDAENKESRVVFRQAGNLRVLINTKIWSGMIAEQPSQKSLRLTAMDNNGQVKVFLVMSRPDVIVKLHKELTKRIQIAKEITSEKDDDVGKENNDENTAKLCEASAAEILDSSKEDPENDEPSPKKRLSSCS